MGTNTGNSRGGQLGGSTENKTWGRRGGVTKPLLTKSPSVPTFGISAAQQRMELEQTRDICISKEQGRLKGHRGQSPSGLAGSWSLCVCAAGGGGGGRGPAQPSGLHSGVSRSAVSSSLLRPMLPSLTCTLESPVRLQKLLILWVPRPGCSGVGPGHLGLLNFLQVFAMSSQG